MFISLLLVVACINIPCLAVLASNWTEICLVSFETWMSCRWKREQ